MKLTVDRNELWRGLNTVLDAVASKPAQPVLANVLLDAAESQLTLSATDLDLSIRTKVAAAVDMPGRITVPAKTLAEITREWPEADLQISLEDGRITLAGHLGAANSGEGRYSLAATPPDEFPEMPEKLDGLELTFGDGGPIDGDLVRAMIDRTSFAVSKDETRPVLNGVLWRITADYISMVATDGSRMAEFRKSLDGADRGTAEVILPPQACQQLGKLLDGTQDALSKAIVGDSQVMFQIGETQLLTRLIEGPYVDYEQVVPRENDKRLTIAIDQLLPAVRHVSDWRDTTAHTAYRGTLCGL